MQSCEFSYRIIVPNDFEAKIEGVDIIYFYYGDLFTQDRKKIQLAEDDYQGSFRVHSKQKNPEFSGFSFELTWWLLDKAITYFQQESLSINTP